MVEQLAREGYILSKNVRKAFESVARELFVPLEYRARSYVDMPLPIGEGQTISAPSMVAIMLEVSDLSEGLNTLEIGAGSGYNACLIAQIVGDGNLVTIERIHSVYLQARENLKNCSKTVDVVHGDGTEGWPEKAPYDRIIITAAAPELPGPLKEQLKVGGKIIAPVGRTAGFQTLTVAIKQKDGSFKEKRFGACAFVPLIGTYGF
jgi:protein-L-isoaspartate(D-aspartate) O-methyltransferase